MGKFWLGYLAGRNSGGGSVPPGLAIAAAIFFAFVGAMLLLQSIFEAIAAFTRANPVVTLAIVGAATVAIAELFGTNAEKDPGDKILTPGVALVLLTGLFYLVGLVVGSTDPDVVSGLASLPLYLLSFGIGGAFLYMLYSLLTYRCQTGEGRLARTASLVLVVWYFWAVAAGLEIGVVPVVGGDALLFGGIAAALAAGGLEAAAEAGGATGDPTVHWERDAEPAETD
ncbi:hypothetical protein ACKVMT_15780 [Halobacteriales archaeon Cl-PHB]